MKKTTIRCTMPDGTVIVSKNNTDTFRKIIEYAKPERVHALNIIRLKDNIVSKEKRWTSHADEYTEIGGWAVTTAYPTHEKYNILCHINDHLNLGLNLELLTTN